MNKVLSTVFLILLCIFSTQSYAQRTRCHNNGYPNDNNQRRGIAYPNQFEEWMQGMLSQQRLIQSVNQATRKAETKYRLPIVVHIIHKGESYGVESNITDEQILSQIKATNVDLALENANFINTPEVFKPYATSLNIELILAKRDPQGNPTNGITRSYGGNSNWLYKEESLKSIIQWDPEKYFNIWVCDYGNDLGFSSWPVSNLPGMEALGSTPQEDGVIVNYTAFGSNDFGGPYPILEEDYDLGRTLTHEMGHYLGLFHTWGTGGCSNDDYVEDTPMTSGSYTGGCDLTQPIMSCGQQTMIENYMDYTLDACMTMFTHGQKDRVEVVLNNSPRRLSLLTSDALIPVDPSDYYDLALFDVEYPIVTSTPDIDINIIAKNLGNQINNVAFSVKSQSVAYNDTLKSLPLFTQNSTVNKIISPKSLSYIDSIATFDVEVEIIDEDIYDFNPSNNFSTNLNSYLHTKSDFIPYKISFEYEDENSNKWAKVSKLNRFAWKDSTIIENNKEISFLTLTDNNYINDEAWLVSPLLNVKEVSEAYLEIGYTFQAEDNNSSDSLFVYYSTELPERYILLDTIELNNTQGHFKSNVSLSEKINLNSFLQEENLRIGLVKKGGLKGLMGIHEINFYENDVLNTKKPEENSHLIFPNPTKNKRFKIRFNLNERQDITCNIYSISGRIVKSINFDGTINQIQEIDLSKEPQGIYFIKIAYKNSIETDKIILR
ncbi:M43 family zinc metalloprotease [Aureibacter tunicatorum]|uniref:Secreted protein (Por secretion system target) n=1 Tax=Aureibacter tunicatorum TaxID=866807 RepID=A0AAE3XNS0_9BACT|nr:M43 family zinc metalloprotease [Aureibacter tunicatorum]MDR6239348.1 hypothetical protein [Aureibacter tunicatorum]BDD04729.1 hypothetical protein AUTU_22120 [Aureibacter tunicatorum]